MTAIDSTPAPQEPLSGPVMSDHLSVVPDVVPTSGPANAPGKPPKNSTGNSSAKRAEARGEPRRHIVHVGGALNSRYALIAADVSCVAFYYMVDVDSEAPFVLSTAMTIALFAFGHLYEPKLHLSLLDDLPSLVGRMIVATLFVAEFLAVTDVAPTKNFLAVSLAGGCLHLTLRGLTFYVIRLARRRGIVAHRIVVIGGGQLSGELAFTLLENKEYGLLPVGCVDTLPPLQRTLEMSEWLGSTGELERLMSEHEVNILLIAFGSDRESELVELIRRRAFEGYQVFLVPRLFEVDVRARPGDHIGVVPIVRLPRRTLKGPSWRLKRAFDVAVAFSALVLLSPVLLGCALAVRLEGGPGVIFRQIRVGRDGLPFELYKFRSMKPATEGGGDTTWSIAGDRRVGPVGRVLRATSLDELPQLWNILRGDMTIVGPRPERPHFVEQFSAQYPRYRHRHRVPVGLTGLAQVSGLRGDTSIGDRALYDNFYIESWSFWLDIKVIIRTVREVVRGGGAG